jgi:mannosylglycerate hydrolase
MTTLHLIAHTHWDREWYLTFQQLRIKLFHLVDGLLAILERDPSFTHFMLDGQTIMLEDYLAIRPERATDLERLIRAGRILVGPWYILPDEFLVSPEATLRNLLRGKAVAARFGARMDVGYIPDPFGHIGQMPQILAGFGIDSAALRRGLADEPCEVWWEAPDGTRALTAYLRDGYDNAARLPTRPEAFDALIRDRADSLLAHAATPDLLLMNGTDHQEPQPEIPELLRGFASKDAHLILSTLPTYFREVRSHLASTQTHLPVVKGELRNPKRHHLLPAVLSSRVWVKQRNHVVETTLERWAEPFAAWAEALAVPSDARSTLTGHLTTPRVQHPGALIEAAWRLLMECHPHDTICGCSIDAVYEETRPRFDQAEQIAEEVTRQSLASLAQSVDTQGLARQGALGAIVVFNPLNGPRTGVAAARITLGAGLSSFEIVDARGQAVPYRLRHVRERPLADMDLDADGLRAMLGMVQDGHIMGLVIEQVAVVRQSERVVVDVVLTESGEPGIESLRAASAQVDAILSEAGNPTFHLQARLPAEVDIQVLARGIPAHGWVAYGLRPVALSDSSELHDDLGRIENEFLIVEADESGTIAVTDRRSGTRYAGLMRLSDRGDRGDSYTFCPVEGDLPVLEPKSPATIRRRTGQLCQSLDLTMEYRMPARLTPDRSGRGPEMVDIPVEASISLVPGIPQVEIELRIDNRAEDHRLQALFPLGRAMEEGIYDGAFEIVRRPTRVPAFDSEWIEQPVAEAPIRAFVAARAGDRGLAIATRGLREASVSPEGVMAVTLLRCFGWLSQDDLATRKGGAGPKLETPGGQEPGLHVFNLCVIPFQADLLTAAGQAYDYQAPMRGIGSDLHAGRLPSSDSFLRWEPGAFALTAVKPSAAGDAVVVRGVNLGDTDIVVGLECLLPIRRAARVRLDETELADVAVDGGRRLIVPLGPHKLLSLRLELASQIP